MNEYGKRVAKKMENFMDEPNSVDREINDIQNAIEGYEVRGALAAGVKKSFDKSKVAQEKSEEATEITQNLLDDSFDTSKINANFEERLDKEIKSLQPEWTQFKDDTTSQLADIAINVSRPPADLSPVLMDGTDETDKLQAILDWVGDNGGGVVRIPRGTIYHTINYIPNNVILEGVGYQTEIKLVANFNPEFEVRKPSGIYCNDNVEFFGVRNLTYNGNASNNLHEINDQSDYDLYYSHGIVNRYIDKEVDPYSQDREDKAAKKFHVENVYVKDVIRNSLLITGKTAQMGTVKNVILENSYMDHFIYESNTNAKVTYLDVTTKGFWRGAAIVASGGSFIGIKHIDPTLNPIELYNLFYYLQVRNYKISDTIKTEASFSSLKLDLLFETMHAVINEFNSDSSYSIRGAQVNQMDSNELSVYESSISFLLTNGTYRANIDGVELNNIVRMNLLYVNDGTRDIAINNVKFNYADIRDGNYKDMILGLNSLSGPVKNIRISNIEVPEKAPTLLNFYKSPSSTDVSLVENIQIENVNLITDDNTVILLDVLTRAQYYDGERIIIKNSKFNGYGSLGTGYIGFRDKYNLRMVDTIINGTNSNSNVVVTLPQGTQEREIDFPYIITAPRFISSRGRYLGSMIPTLRVGGLKMTITYDEPLSSYEELYITSEF